MINWCCYYCACKQAGIDVWASVLQRKRKAFLGPAIPLSFFIYSNPFLLLSSFSMFLLHCTLKTAPTAPPSKDHHSATSWITKAGTYSPLLFLTINCLVCMWLLSLTTLRLMVSTGWCHFQPNNAKHKTGQRKAAFESSYFWKAAIAS